MSMRPVRRASWREELGECIENGLLRREVDAPEPADAYHSHSV
jgi:hypothetical protein